MDPDAPKKRAASSTAKDGNKDKKTRSAAAEELVRRQMAIPVKTDYSTFGKLDPKTERELSGVDPFGPGKGRHYEGHEKGDVQGKMYYQLQAEMQHLIPLARKDQEAAERHATLQKGTTPILESIIGNEAARSCIFQNVRHHFGPVLAPDEKEFLLSHVFNGDETHFKIEEATYHKCPYGYKPDKNNEKRVFGVLHTQMEHYAHHIAEENPQIRANAIAKEFLLSLRALSGRDKSSPEFKSLVMGLVLHHLNDVPGPFNGSPPETIDNVGPIITI